MEQQTVSIRHIRNIGVIASTSDYAILMRDLINYNWGENCPPIDLFSGIDYELGVYVHATRNTVYREGYQYNFIFVPQPTYGWAPFEEALRNIESAIIVLDAQKPVPVDALYLREQLHNYCIPYLYFVDNCLPAVLDNFEDWLPHHASHPHASLYVPIYATEDEVALIGHISLLDMQAMRYPKERYAKVCELMPLPKELEAHARLQHTTFIESIVEHDEQLFQEYLDGHAMPLAAIVQALRVVVIHARLHPVLYGPGRYGGIKAHLDTLLDAMRDYLPAPFEDIVRAIPTRQCARIFCYTLTPHTEEFQEKVRVWYPQILVTHPTLQASMDVATASLTLSGDNIFYLEDCIYGRKSPLRNYALRGYLSVSGPHLYSRESSKDAHSEEKIKVTMRVLAKDYDGSVGIIMDLMYGYKGNMVELDVGDEVAVFVFHMPVGAMISFRKVCGYYVYLIPGLHWVAEPL